MFIKQIIIKHFDFFIEKYLKNKNSNFTVLQIPKMHSMFASSL